MEQNLTPEQQKAVGVIISVMIIVGAIILFMRQIFPIFLIGSIVIFFLLIISGIIEFFFRDHDYLDIWDYVSTYFGILFIIFILGMFISYEIGYGIGGTSFGQASMEVYLAFTGMQQEVDKAINQFVEENCKVLSEESCNILRDTAKSAKTLQEVSDMADKLKKA